MKKQGFDDYQIYNVPKHPDNQEYMEGWKDGEHAHEDDMDSLEFEAEEFHIEGEYRDEDDYD